MYRVFALTATGKIDCKTEPYEYELASAIAYDWAEINRKDRTSPVKTIEIRHRRGGIALRLTI